MKKHALLLIVTLTAIITFSCQKSELITWKSLVDDVVKEYENENGPGGVVAIARGNQIVYSKSFGYADVANKVLNTETTLFDIASCAKQFTAASVLILEEQGMIDLNLPIQHYFPEFVIEEPIPVRSLLTHSSGIHDYSEMLLLARGRSESTTFSKEDILTTIYQQTNLSFSPLNDEKYSNSNFVILAELVERVSNLTFEEFVGKNIFDPLGITSSEIQFLGAEKADSVNLAIGYPHRPKDRPEFIAENLMGKQHNLGVEIDYALGASGIKANLQGLVKWMGNYKSGKIGDASLMELLLKKDTLTNGNLTIFARGLESGSVPQGYTWIEHTGRNNFTSVMAWWPDFDISMIALTNTQEIWAQSITNSFCMDILATLPPPNELFRKKEEVKKQEKSNKASITVSKKPAIELSMEQMDNFVGTYRAEAAVGGRRPPSGGVGVNKIKLEDGNLVGIRYDGSRFNLHPVSPMVLAVEDSPMEFQFVDLGTDKPGFSFVNLKEETNSNEIAYRIPKLSPKELEQFCGNYTSPTLMNSIPIEIFCDNKKLLMKWGIEKNIAELHYLEDGRLTTYVEGPITGMQCNLVLKRNEKGEVTGFNYDGHRVWNLYFEKQKHSNDLEI
jgi:CubicO group peptidase (beta-lactamase class C family)